MTCLRKENGVKIKMVQECCPVLLSKETLIRPIFSFFSVSLPGLKLNFFMNCLLFQSPHIVRNSICKEQSFFILVNFVANIQVLSLKIMKSTLQIDIKSLKKLIYLLISCQSRVSLVRKSIITFKLCFFVPPFFLENIGGLFVQNNWVLFFFDKQH